MEEGFNINYNLNTNEDISVIYTPSSIVKSYNYKLIKNGNTIESNNLDGKLEILLNEEGNYKIEILYLDSSKNEVIETSPIYRIDKTSPIISITNKTYKIKENEDINFGEVSAFDTYDGDLSSKITTNINDIDFTNPGIKKIEYRVSDSSGNEAIDYSYVTVISSNNNALKYTKFGIAIIFILFIILILKFIRSIKLERRFSKFTINSSKNSSNSILDIISDKYTKIEKKLSVVLSKSAFVKSISKRYNKYVDITDDIDEYILIARKILIGFLYLIVVFIVMIINSKIMKSYEILLIFLLGYYTMDLIYIYKYKNYKKKVENDFLQAINIMNNAFKSSMSITQAVDLVYENLDGPIANEFKKISLELSYGLDYEVAFKRFAKRIKIKEALYLTSSLSVLNKTGGDIVKVFKSIEKTLYSKKKLEDELKSLTSSSKLIMYVLIIVPPLFVIFVSFLNPSYFVPLISNAIGFILILIMIIIYIAYIIVVRHVMKVKV